MNAIFSIVFLLAVAYLIYAVATVVGIGSGVVSFPAIILSLFIIVICSVIYDKK